MTAATWGALLALAQVSAVLTAACAASPARVEVSETQVALDNGRCRLELSRVNGEILTLTPGLQTLRGPWFEVVVEDRRQLHSWETWKQGTESVFAGGPAEVTGQMTGDTATARATWHLSQGLEVTAEVMLSPAAAGPLVRLTVSNATGAALVDTIRVPVLRGLELGDPQDDWFTWPHTLGTAFRVQGFRPGQRVEQPYPDFLSMQWLDLHDAAQGVYVGCLDDYGYTKSLFIGRAADGRSEMGISFVGCWIATAGDAWTTPWVQIAAHEGDWRSGAALYRGFAERAFGPLDPPERVREMPTAQCWLAHHASDGDIGKLFEIQQQAPIHGSYLMKSVNTSTPEGWDGMRGSALELSDSFARIKQLGGSASLFTFDRAPLMGKPNYADHVGKWVCRRRDGSFAEGFRDMMPAPWHPDLVRARVGEATRWVQAFGLDEIHLDTDATTGPALAGPCYDPASGHRPNEVPHYFKALFRAIRDACRRYNPDFLLRAEHCADFFFPEFLTSTAHFFEGATLVAAHNPPIDARLVPNLFRTTLPRHAALLMPSVSENDFWTYGFGMGHGFHGGGPSWCFNPGVREAEAPPGELLHRYHFCDGEWRRYYDFRVGFEEAVVDSQWSDVVAEVQIEGQWQRCDYPGPLVAVTHGGGGREVTLGQWYHLSRTSLFAERMIGTERLPPRPVRVRVPTRLSAPQVRLFGETGEFPVEPSVAGGWVEALVPDPTCFALEVFEGPAIALQAPLLARPGETVAVGISIRQPDPRPGQLSLKLPAGWPAVSTLSVPAEPQFTATIPARVPPGLFGRNYPLKAVLRTGSLKRTCATHLRVMEPLTVLYGFDAVVDGQPRGTHCVDPGKPARLTVTCVNNSPLPAQVTLRVQGEQVRGEATRRLDGLDFTDCGRADSPLRRWIEQGAAPPACAWVHTFDFDCAGVPAGPVRIEALLDGERTFIAHAFPRTRLMDLNGPWRVRYTPASRATVGGAERNDNLDTEAVTGDVWDGDWEVVTTPLRLDEAARHGKGWALYRRLVYVPSAWQGAELYLRLSHMGAPWGQGGTLNLVYVNGWPAGRIGTAGERPVSPFLVFGGWNLLAVASAWPNSLVDPYLFVRAAPAPYRLLPAEPGEPPSGAFILLGQRCSGAGISLPFVQGVPAGDHRRTDLAAGGENAYIYFAVADEYLREPREPVEVQVEYLDEGHDDFGLDYDSTDDSAPVHGAFKSAAPCRRTDSGQWRTHVFRLADARLANRQHLGADFRLWARGTDLRVRRVTVLRGPS